MEWKSTDDPSQDSFLSVQEIKNVTASSCCGDRNLGTATERWSLFIIRSDTYDGDLSQGQQ